MRKPGWRDQLLDALARWGIALLMIGLAYLTWTFLLRQLHLR